MRLVWAGLWDKQISTLGHLMLHVYIEALSWFSPYTVLKVSAPHHHPKAASLGQLLGARKRASGGAFEGQESSGETQSAGVLLIVKQQSRF